MCFASTVSVWLLAFALSVYRFTVCLFALLSLYTQFSYLYSRQTPIYTYVLSIYQSIQKVLLSLLFALSIHSSISSDFVCFSPITPHFCPCFVQKTHQFINPSAGKFKSKKLLVCPSGKSNSKKLYKPHNLKRKFCAKCQLQNENDLLL